MPTEETIVCPKCQSHRVKAVTFKMLTRFSISLDITVEQEFSSPGFWCFDCWHRWEVANPDSFAAGIS